MLSLTLIALPALASAASTACGNPGGTGGCFSTIQAAVDSAPSTVIDVAAGTYGESVVNCDLAAQNLRKIITDSDARVCARSATCRAVT